jgi:hypothetical protein
MLNKSLSSTNYSAYTKAVSQDESCLSQLRVSLGKPVFMVPICIICFVGHLFSAIGTAGTFSINDPTSTKPPQIFELVLATILNGEDEGGSLGFPTDNRSFPKCICSASFKLNNAFAFLDMATP